MTINYNGKHGLTFARIDAELENMFAYDSWLDFHLIPTARPYIAFPEIEPKIVSIPGTNKRYDVTRFLPGGMQKGIRKGTWSFIIDHNQWPNWAECQHELTEYFHGHLFYVTLNDEADAVDEGRREGPPKHYAGRLTVDGFDTGENYTTVTIGYSLSDKLANIPSANIYYTITFLDQDGRVLQDGLVTVREGEIPEFTGTLPEIEDWIFTHWEPELKPAYRNETYRAVYEYARKSSLIERTITAFNDPNGLVDSIGQYAFAGCTLLSEVTLGANSVVPLANSNALYSTKVATSTSGSVYVPESLVSEYKTSTNWSQYSTRIHGIGNLNNAEHITESEASIVNRTIETAFGPESIIGLDAFRSCLNLQSVNFPVCSRIIGGAFYNCSDLQYVSFPVCDYIGASAFAYCSNLQSVNFPVCDYIGASAFAYCSNLQSVNFPVCSRIVDYAFYDCSNLQSVSFPVCSYIASYAFRSCSSLQSINFPVCNYIGASAFRSCSSLQSINFPVCNYIGASAFGSCSSLQNASFPVCSYVGSYAFERCSSLQNASFPVCSYIGAYAFGSCLSLQSISFPVCSYVGTYAFAGCSNLQSVSFPVCSFIASHAFEHCSGLQSVNFPVCSRIVDYAFYDCSNLQSVSFPVCSYIASYAFRSCSSLQSINFPVCDYIGSGVFYDCSDLQYVSFPVCSYVDSYAFERCSSLQNASFPVCSYIGASAFGSCSSLQSISFPVCSKILDHAFERCSKIQFASFPVCNYIGYCAFLGCSNLQSVSFPVCNTIGTSAFAYCSNLQSISFPVCGKIGFSAFKGCSNLQALYLLSTSVCSIMFNAFDSTPIRDSQYLGYYGSIYVPASLVDAYKSQYSEFSDRITAYTGN